MAKRTAQQGLASDSGSRPTARPLDDESARLWDTAFDGAARDLLNAAVQCFASNGYHATTTRDISTRAGLSPAAMYVHFGSKELVLFEIVRTAHERALAEIRAGSTDATGNVTTRLSELVSRYTVWHARHHVAAKVAQFELGGLAAAHYDEVLGLRRATGDVFRQVVTAGVRQGTFAVDEVSPVVRALLSLSIDLVRWYRLEDHDSPEELGRLYAELAVRMVRA